MTASKSGGSVEAPTGVGRVIAAFVRRRVAGSLLMLLAIGGGLFVASGIDVEIIPDVDGRKVEVTVPYPGSSPTEVEESITRRIEERVVGLAGVRRAVSKASSDVGTVRLSVDPFADTEEVLEEVRTAVDRIERFPPPDAERPEIGIPFVHVPAITVALSSRELSAQALRIAAEQLREDMLALPSVSNVSLDWSPEREIAIEVDEEALREHGLTIAEVARKVRSSSVDLTSGRLLTGAGGMVVRVDDRRVRAEEFDDVVLLSAPSGALVTVGDVAEVSEGFGDAVGTTELDGVPAVFLTALAVQRGQSEVEIADDVRAMLAGYAPPPGAELTVWQDSSRRASARLELVTGTGALGLVLVFFVLAFVFDFRLATWVAVGLPVSFLGAMMLFPTFDLTFNVATIFAMIMMIGIVVDDAVVVGESVSTERERGLVGADAAVAGARRVFWPVAVGIATTLLAFAPLLFTYGVVGQFLSVFPLVALLVLGVSLVEAFLILPSHLAHGGDWSRWPMSAVQARIRQAIEDLRDRVAVPAVALATRRPVGALMVAGALVVVSGILLLGGVVRFGEVAALGTGRVEAALTYPVGTPLEVARVGARQLEEAARRSNQQLGGSPILSVATVVGHHPPRGIFVGDGGRATHLAAVTLQLREESQRTVSADEVARAWRRNAGEIVGADRLTFSTADRYGGNGYDLSVALVHPDGEVLARAVEDLVAALEASPGVLDVFDSLTPGRRHFDLHLTPAGQAAGLTGGELATQLRARFFGTEVQRIQRGRDEVKVMVRYPEDRRRSLAELVDERIVLPVGGDIPLGVAARVVETRELESLMRIDGVRAAEVGSFVDQAVLMPRELRAQVEGSLLPELQGRYPGLGLKWARAGVDDDEESLGPLAYTLPVVLLLIYMIIAVQFRSYAQPLVVLTAMPLAAAGAVLAHLVLGYDMNLTSVFGVVAVLGVVINDTLLLMDRFNSLRAASALPAIAAIAGAVRERFRPIFLTTITTIGGLLPVLYLKSEATITNYVPIVVSIIGGLVAGSAGILFVVPAILLLGEGVRERTRIGWLRQADTAA
ncbi:MAG: efflux RND transporter permease subunit [Gammaproteobacteria bacterium]|nr:efflux RND transporter permease subunit [Gammaproteobacteria bacterium]MDE0367981.1 efflux RND transporter permease subunit [Gammaproteobacteria bacterium]